MRDRVFNSEIDAEEISLVLEVPTVPASNAGGRDETS